MRKIKDCYKKIHTCDNEKYILQVHQYTIALQSNFRLYYSFTRDKVGINKDYRENTWVYFNSIKRVKK